MKSKKKSTPKLRKVYIYRKIRFAWICVYGLGVIFPISRTRDFLFKYDEPWHHITGPFKLHNPLHSAPTNGGVLGGGFQQTFL
jgi:hypothetical protein